MLLIRKELDSCVTESISKFIQLCEEDQNIIILVIDKVYENSGIQILDLAASQ